MNLNNNYPIKRNLELKCLEQNPVHGEMFIKEWNLHQWQCVYYLKYVGYNKPSKKIVVERFFGNDYDRSYRLHYWNWEKSRSSGKYNAEPEHMMK